MNTSSIRAMPDNAAKRSATWAVPPLRALGTTEAVSSRAVGCQHPRVARTPTGIVPLMPNEVL